jgi:hypothetical protein
LEEDIGFCVKVIFLEFSPHLFIVVEDNHDVMSKPRWEESVKTFAVMALSLVSR